MTQDIGFEVNLDVPYEQAVDFVIEALKEEGFGVLTRIDVKATLKSKIDVDFRPYVILGACNPPLAHKALSADSVVGLMLPCNITVEANPDGGATARLANPELMMTIGGLQNNQSLVEVAREARIRIERVATGLLGS